MASSISFVLFVLFAIFSGSRAVQVGLQYDFDGLDLAQDDVLVDSIFFPFNFTGVVDVTVSSNLENPTLLCINWLVPAEAPAGVDLTSIWPNTCAEFAFVTSSNQTNSFNLRAGLNYFSVAVSGDVASTGIPDDVEITVSVSYQECPPGTFGVNCAAFSPLGYGDNTVNIVSGGDNDPSYFTLPTSDDANKDRFVKDLVFTFSFDDSEDDTTLTLSARLNAPINGAVVDFLCESKSSGQKCSLPSPPMVFAQNYFWTISLFGSSAIEALQVSISQSKCPSGRVGENCVRYEELDTDLGEVSKYTGREFFVFDNISHPIQLAVGGLNGFTQTKLAPPVYAQIDGGPNTNGSWVLKSNGSMTNIIQIDLSSDLDFVGSKVVVWVDTKKSYGIWLFDETADVFCADPCDKHGSCNNATFVCKCDKNYEDLGCNHKKDDFTIEYVILIAVGGLLILAIVIGVPLYCYLNRQSGYEAVA